jgi:hypothetical protein
VLAFLLRAIEEYSEAPDISEGSGASSISDSAYGLAGAMDVNRYRA